jgi:hypothetical protein
MAKKYVWFSLGCLIITYFFRKYGNTLYQIKGKRINLVEYRHSKICEKVKLCLGIAYIGSKYEYRDKSTQFTN